MQITDVFAAEGENKIYSVSLEPGFFVDVKVSAGTDLVYVMENGDGSTVYGLNGPDSTYPNYPYALSAVIDFVKAVHQQDLAWRKPLTYDKAFAKREDLKGLVDVLSPQACADLFGRPVWDGSVIFLPTDKNGREGHQTDRKASLDDQIQSAGKKRTAAPSIEHVSKEHNH